MSPAMLILTDGEVFSLPCAVVRLSRGVISPTELVKVMLPVPLFKVRFAEPLTVLPNKIFPVFVCREESAVKFTGPLKMRLPFVVVILLPKLIALLLLP